MQIGSINLGSYSAVATSSYDYYKSDGGEIIGGAQTIKITGSVVVGDEQSMRPGAMVMSNLASIVQLGQTPQCVMVSIPGQYSGMAKIENVTTSQGSDPTWINKAEFSIELKAPLKSIPPNSFGITAKDSVVELSRSSKIELPEDSHGYVYSGSFHKTYAVAVSELNFRCEPICQPGFSLISVIGKLYKQGLHTAFSGFSGWNQYAKSRSVQVTSDNSVTINTQYIITPHQASAFTDLSFAHSRTYAEGESTKKIISGTVTGLTDISIFNTYGFTGTCVSSKLANAESTFADIKSRFANISSWEGITLELLELPNPFALNATDACNRPAENDERQPCIKPYLSTVSKSRTEGVIDFNFEWSTDTGDQCGADTENRISTDITIDVIEPQRQFVEHVIPLRGTLIQDLNTKNARRVNVQIVTTYPQDLCTKPSEPCEENIEEILNQYNITGLLIKDTLTVNKRSVTRDRSYIEC